MNDVVNTVATKDYKDTLNLPDTAFAMKANLAVREAQWLTDWQADNLYTHIRNANIGKPKYILHDGPPYANGQIHLGHAVNKVLKDIIVKHKTLSGFDAPYVPGWDCHGLPIELQVEKKVGKVGVKVDANTFRKHCRDYANEQVILQKHDFERLGVLGDWQNPYLTMNFKQEADTVRALAKIVKAGHVQAGLKPVNWCLDCGSSLAEAEVEYEDKKSDAIDVGFAVVDVADLSQRIGTNVTGTVDVVIWTTTPWTLPANQAVSLHPDFNYSLVQVTPHQSKATTFEQPTHLETTHFTLCTLTPQDEEALYSAASDPLIWEMHPSKRHLRPVFTDFFATAMSHGAALAIKDKKTQQIIGTTRFYDWNVEEQSIALGYTFLTPVHWGTGANQEIKQCLLDYAFKQVQQVLLHVSPTNLRSRKAVEKLGATFIREADFNGLPHCFYAISRHAWLKETAITTNEKLCLIIATDLVEEACNRYKLTDVKTLATFQGKVLEHLQLQHPLIPARQVPVILGEHVTASSGTGAVHTAPGHGVDDYKIGLVYNLKVDNPVSGSGVYLPDAPVFAGEHIYKANPLILEKLKDNAKLWAHVVITHSYPHCWRHKTPIIFRATPQWFISMEQHGLRNMALDAIKQVQWVPEWGQNRIEAMVEGRPDWCISRQRTWGVPIPFFVHKDTGALHPNTEALIEKVAQLIDKGGVEAWFNLDKDAFLGADASTYTATKDTLDVWFDSGATHFAVVEQRPELAQMPVDLYLEGSDQHRGWFQTSLLTGIAMNNSAPFKQVLTHGFVVDENGYKMSKSKGNIITPQEMIKDMGADGVRFWVASSDYRYEMTAGKETFSRAVDGYRRIRNTLRFLLANLNGFAPSQHLVPIDQMIALDQFIVARADQVQQDIIAAYEAMDFHQVTQLLTGFCTKDLGGFYLDIIKDRQYTTKADSIARRSAQTALYHIVQALVRWMSPILSFTAQEAWPLIPEQREKYVFTTQWYNLPISSAKASISASDWDVILNVKSATNKLIEEARNAKTIGANLSASVTLWATTDIYHVLSKLENELRFVLITSNVNLNLANGEHGSATELTGLRVTVEPATGTKCARCWHVLPSVGTNSEHPTLCPRCITNVAGGGEVRHYA